jgi:hypothetical protein
MTYQENQINMAYAEAFQRCVLFTEGLTIIPRQVSEDTIKANIREARDYYNQVKDKGSVSIMTLSHLNELESKFKMEITE